MCHVELIRQEFKTLQQLDGFTIKPNFADINSYYKKKSGTSSALTEHMRLILSIKHHHIVVHYLCF